MRDGVVKKQCPSKWDLAGDDVLLDVNPQCPLDLRLRKVNVPRVTCTASMLGCHSRLVASGYDLKELGEKEEERGSSWRERRG